jgi:hypothetical protein
MGSLTSHNPIGLQGLLRDNFTYFYLCNKTHYSLLVLLTSDYSFFSEYASYKLYIRQKAVNNLRINRYFNGFSINIQPSEGNWKIFISHLSRVQIKILLAEPTCSVEVSKFILNNLTLYRMNITNYCDNLRQR